MEIIVKHKNEERRFSDELLAYLYAASAIRKPTFELALKCARMMFEAIMKDDNPTPILELVDFVNDYENLDELDAAPPRELLRKFYDWKSGL